MLDSGLGVVRHVAPENQTYSTPLCTSARSSWRSSSKSGLGYNGAIRTTNLSWKLLQPRDSRQPYKVGSKSLYHAQLDVRGSGQNPLGRICLSFRNTI